MGAGLRGRGGVGHGGRTDELGLDGGARCEGVAVTGAGDSEQVYLASSDAVAEAFGVVELPHTFVIDPQGNIARHYEKVDPDEHAAEVLADLEAMGAGK